MGGHTYSMDVEYSAPGRTHSVKSNATYSGSGYDFGPKKGWHRNRLPLPSSVRRC
jgi:hypothetical protein